ncbi:MAG: hypothetical protein AAFQ80_17385 [Cyanobacteria bacterium J06621_8]
MKILSNQELEKLFNIRERLCVSLYLPTEKAGSETRQNSIGFKNLLHEAESKLIDSGLTASEAAEFLQEANALIDNYDFWQHQAEGLAYFQTQNTAHYYCLPENFTSSVEISDRFYLKPLLPLFTKNNEFYLLALAQNEIRLFRGNKYGLQPLELPEDVPASFDEAMRYEDPEKQLQSHSTQGDRNPVFHGQGAGNSDSKNDILRYFQQIDRGLSSFLKSKQIPLILAGVDYLFPLYQEANSYATLLPKGIVGNPEHLSSEELYQKAQPIIQSQFHQAEQEAKQEYQELLATKQASADIKQIIPAAYNGQVDTLFITANLRCWGKFKPETNSIQVEQNSTEDNLDLLDFAAIHTFLQGGVVYLMPQEQMPDAESVAAIYRYPVYANSEKTAS